MKKILALALALLMLFPLASCGKSEVATTTEEAEVTKETVDDTTIRMMAMIGPTGMGLASLIHNDKENSGNLADYEIELVSSPDQVTARILGKECDIAAVPINLASVLYKKTQGKIRILCANTLGVLSILENGSSINSIADLKGKTIYAPNPGSTPEYVLRYVLKKNGIDPDKDVTLQFLTGGDEVAAALGAAKAKGEEAVGMLPEPKLSAFLSQNSDFHVCLDMTAEWDKVAGEGNTLVQGVFVARSEFVEEHPVLIANFLSDYEKSQNFVNSDPEKGAELIVEAGIIPKAPLAKKAIPGSHITYLAGSEMKSAVSSCLKVLCDFNPASIGGEMPADDIYFH